MKIVEPLEKTIADLKALRLKAAYQHDWIEFTRLTNLIESTKRYKQSWEATQGVDHAANAETA